MKYDEHHVLLKTSGKGLWSRAAKVVHVLGFDADYLGEAEDNNFGELRVYFNTKAWSNSKDGLIYTDPGFEFQLKKYLRSMGINVTDLGYSEQGMQGDDYVSFDIGPKFIQSWKEAGRKIEVLT